MSLTEEFDRLRREDDCSDLNSNKVGTGDQAVQVLPLGLADDIIAGGSDWGTQQAAVVNHCGEGYVPDGS